MMYIIYIYPLFDTKHGFGKGWTGEDSWMRDRMDWSSIYYLDYFVKYKRMDGNDVGRNLEFSSRGSLGQVRDLVKSLA